jgi:nicotinamidase-related amidase
VPEIELEKFGVKAHAKTCFTMVLPELMAELETRQPGTKSVVLCGIETQACIFHTTLDLLERGFEVHIPVDCASSRSMLDRRMALERLRQVACSISARMGFWIG